MNLDFIFKKKEPAVFDTIHSICPLSLYDLYMIKSKKERNHLERIPTECRAVCVFCVCVCVWERERERERESHYLLSSARSQKYEALSENRTCHSLLSDLRDLSNPYITLIRVIYLSKHKDGYIGLPVRFGLSNNSVRALLANHYTMRGALIIY